MLFKELSVALIPLSFFLVQAQAQTGPAQVPTEPDHFDLSLIDKGIDPCVDFYQYSCKKWIAANPFPPTSHHGPTVPNSRCGTRECYATRWKRRRPRTPIAARSNREIGDYYASCMDEGRDRHQRREGDCSQNWLVLAR